MSVVKNYDEFIEESYLADNKGLLYQWTESKNLFSIFMDDFLKKRFNAEFLSIKGICFTRNIAYDYRKIVLENDVRMVFRKETLSKYYDIVPNDYFPLYPKIDTLNRGFHKGSPYESEEIIKTDKVVDLHKYFVEIHFFNENIYEKCFDEINIYRDKYEIQLPVFLYDNENIFLKIKQLG